MKTNKKELDRRKFLAVTTVGVGAVTVLKPFRLFAADPASDKDPINDSKQIKKDLFTYACSGSLFLNVNRHYGVPKEDQAKAVASLSGGILQEGYQCGMLWGAALAVGAESFRRHKNEHLAIDRAITGTKELMQSFSRRAGCIHCRDITGVDWSGKMSIPKYMLTGKMFTCLKLAKNWAPEAVISFEESLKEQSDIPEQSISCASEVVKKMGASPEQQVMVSGLAGGMGLSGNACGAVAAAIWIRSLAWFTKNPESKDMYNPYAKSVLNAHYKTTNAELECSKICGKSFANTKEHTEFIKNGGCSKLISTIANA